MPWKPGLLNQRSERKQIRWFFLHHCRKPQLSLLALAPHPSSMHLFFPFAPTPFPINPGPVAPSQELCMGIYISLASTPSPEHAAHKYLCWEELWPGWFTLGLMYTLLTAAAKSVSLSRAGTPCGMNSPKFTCHSHNPYSERLSSQKQRNHFRKENRAIWQQESCLHLMPLWVLCLRGRKSAWIWQGSR